MNSTRASSWAPLLAAWFFVGIPHVVVGQEVVGGQEPIYALNVGEYNHFSFLSSIRLSTDVFLDLAEAKSADVRCFHGLDGLKDPQDNVLQEIVNGNMHLGSKIDEKYYVVEPVKVDSDGRVFLDGGPVLPDIWDIPDRVEQQLEHVIERAGSLIISSQGSTSSSWDDLATWVGGDSESHDDLLVGVVTRNPNAFTGLPCERIVNWTGEVETVGYQIR